MFKWLSKMFKIQNFKLSPEDFEIWKREVALPKALDENNVYCTKMSESYCPIAKTNCLLYKCVHFQKSFINYRNGCNSLGFEPFYWVDPPVCKLWVKMS